MGSKTSPGKFDCYEAALPDEPLFTLLARDRLAPALIQIWAMIRDGNHTEARRTLDDLLRSQEAQVYILDPDSEKAKEACLCALEMVQWRAARTVGWRENAT